MCTDAHTTDTHCTPKTTTNTRTLTHTCSIFKVIKRGDFKCSYLFGACCRGNRQCDCAGSLEFLSSCGVRPPCVPLPIFPDPDASPRGWVRAGHRERRERKGLEVKHNTLHCKHAFRCKHTVGYRTAHVLYQKHTPERVLELDGKSQ